VVPVKAWACRVHGSRGDQRRRAGGHSRGTPLEALNFPLLETPTEFVVHGFSFANYLAELGPNAQSEIYSKSSTNLVLRDAFRKMRHFLMTTQKLSEDEAISLMSVAVDFGVTQVVDGNWGIHAIVKKSVFSGS
jgi:acetamidase/formamidase